MTTTNHTHDDDCLSPLLASSPQAVPPPPPYTRHYSQHHQSRATPPLHEEPITFERNGTIGDVKVETSDGEKFLVHREVLKEECAFFYIYYSTHPSPETVSDSASSLFCIGRWFVPQKTLPSFQSSPPLPPKSLPVKSPQPLSHNEWLVPETGPVFFAFISLIYSLKQYPTLEQRGDLGMMRDVLRTSLGYQAERATCHVKRFLADMSPIQPIGVYAVASRYRLHDIAVIASRQTLQVPQSAWPQDLHASMGSKALGLLQKLHEDRLDALKSLLSPSSLLIDDHSSTCSHTEALRRMWDEKVAAMNEGLTSGSTLEELIKLNWKDVVGCESCSALLQDTLVDVLTKERRFKDSI